LKKIDPLEDFMQSFSVDSTAPGYARAQELAKALNVDLNP